MTQETPSDARVVVLNGHRTLPHPSRLRRYCTVCGLEGISLEADCNPWWVRDLAAPGP